MLNLIVQFIDRELEHVEPFTRKIHESEMWLYRNPQIESYVPISTLWVSFELIMAKPIKHFAADPIMSTIVYFQVLVFLMPIVVIAMTFMVYKEKSDVGQAVLSVTLALGLNGVITNSIKNIVGKKTKLIFYIINVHNDYDSYYSIKIAIFYLSYFFIWY